MAISMIYAATSDGLIGRAGKIPWHSSVDMKHFASTTKDSIIVMGRKTWESLPNKLPGRVHVVLTRGGAEIKEGADHVFSGNDAEAVLFVKWLAETHYPGKPVFIIGGSEIYKIFYSHAENIYETVVEYDSPITEHDVVLQGFLVENHDTMGFVKDSEISWTDNSGIEPSIRIIKWRQDIGNVFNNPLGDE